MKTAMQYISKRSERLFKVLLSLTPQTIVIGIIVAVLGCTGASALYIQYSKVLAGKASPETSVDASKVTKTAQEPKTSQTATKEVPSAQKSTSEKEVASTPASATQSNYRPFVCNNIPIHRSTEYINDDSMAAGETKLAEKGQDGYMVSCIADSNGWMPPTNGTRIDPVNDVVYKGTGLDALREQQAAQEQAERDQQYNLSLARCIQNLEAQGMQSGSAESKCRSAVQY